MSFRLSDLKKSVRKAKDGHHVIPARLEGRAPTFKIEFVLQQFAEHVGRPRRMLDPEMLLDFVGDARLGRGLVATLAQWYRMRARTFAEVLADGGAGLRGHDIGGPVDLRAWLYAAVNRDGPGYMDPEREGPFWQGQARALDVRRETLAKLVVLDRPEEAVLVRTGPAPTAADVMAAYNARAHTTLLRSATEVTLECDAHPARLEQAARVWADALEVEWEIVEGALRLHGRADALGCWTRHGRRVERAVLELAALPELDVQCVRGRVVIAEKACHFRWTAAVLPLLGMECGAPLHEPLPEQVAALAVRLRHERDRAHPGAWGIRRAAHVVAVEGAVCLPHLELRRGDLSLYLRLAGPERADAAVEALLPFHGKTPVALAAWSGEPADPVTLQFAGETVEELELTEMLEALEARAERLRAQPAARPERERRTALRPAA